MKNISKAVLVLMTFAVAGCANWQGDHHAQMMQPDYNTTTTTTTTHTAYNTNTRYRSDTAITASVKSKYISQDLFTSRDIASMSIHVKTVNGIVYLSGTADNRTQLKNAISLARSVDGVQNVVSHVRILHRS